jgi:hypothetical protein
MSHIQNYLILQAICVVLDEELMNNEFSQV